MTHSCFGPRGPLASSPARRVIYCPAYESFGYTIAWGEGILTKSPRVAVTR